MISSTPQRVSAVIGRHGVVAQTTIFRRGPDDFENVRLLIEMHRGQVLDARIITRVRPDPFPGFRIGPCYFEYRVRFGDREGTLFVRTGSDERGPEFVWVDRFGDRTPPDTDLRMAVAVRGTGQPATGGWLSWLGLLGWLLLFFWTAS